MDVPLKPEVLRRYKDIAKLLVKYGHSDLIKGIDIEGVDLSDKEAVDERREADPEELARTLEELGPTYIKLGQLLSTRPDLISDRYIQALSRLQDQTVNSQKVTDLPSFTLAL